MSKRLTMQLCCKYKIIAAKVWKVTPLWRLSLVLMIVLCLVLDSAAANQPPSAPTGLLLDLLADPLGVENPNPRMSWIVNDADSDEYQTAYQIVVFDHLEEAASDKNIMWDSGKVESSESSNVPYIGQPLKPGRIYFWKVRTWDKQKQAGAYSNPQRFITGIQDQWTAVPIWGGGSNAPSEPNFLFLRTSFQLPNKDIRAAVAYVTALSPEPASQYVYKFYMNGVLVGVGPQRGFNGIFRYNTFDVTGHLRRGSENVLGAINYTTADKRFLFQMQVYYTDGTTQTIKSDTSWKFLDGDLVYRDQGNAGHRTYYYAPREGLDARKYPFGWNNTGFDDSSWYYAKEKPEIDNLKPSAILNTQTHLVKPKRIVDKGNRAWFIEFDRNMVAGIRLDVIGKAGQEIEIRLSEELSAPETVLYKMRTGNTYQETWTLKEGRQVLENFGYRVFRYAEIHNAPEGFNQDQIQALVMRYPFDDQAALFESSDSVLNQVWNLCKYSVQGNVLDIFVDSHTRERRNYEPDASVHQLSRYAVDRDYAMPRYSIEYLYYRPTWPTEGRLQSVMMAWNDYLYSGNSDSLARNYEVLKTKTLEEFINRDFLVEKPDNVAQRRERDLVDWPASQRNGFEFTTINTAVNAFHYKAIDCLGHIAEVLGKSEDARRYSTLAENLRKAINTHLYDAGARRFKDGKTSAHHALHASAFPLALGVVDPDHIRSVGEFVESRGMATSVYGSHYLLEGLYRAGRGQAALNLMNAVNGNSWGHMMYDLNATMVGEAWDPSLKGNMGFSNPWASAPANAIPRGLFGVIPLEPGFKRFQIKPQPASLSWASLTVPTIKGSIDVVFKNNEDQFEMTVHVPVNTKATIHVPVMNFKNPVIRKNGLVVEGSVENGYIVFSDIGSGRHVFQCSQSISNISK